MHVTRHNLTTILLPVIYALTLVLASGLAPAMAADDSPEPDLADGAVPGPVPARVLRVIDGDTVRVVAHIWLGQEVETNVRLRGVDAAEMHAHCEAERQLAERARDFVVGKLAGDRVELLEINYDKYGRRVVARMVTARGEDMSQALLAAGLAHVYEGGHKQPWCGG